MPPGGKPYKFTAAAREAALKAMEKTGNRQAAADAAGVALVTIERHLAKDPEFKQALEEARNRFVKTLEDEAYRRAVEGWDEPKAMGKLIVDVRKFDSSLLLHLLKKNDPEKHGDRVKIDQTTVQVTTDMGLENLSPESRAQLEEILLREAQNEAETEGEEE